MTVPKLIPLLESMLRAAGMTTTNDGFVKMEYRRGNDVELIPATRNGKQMVLPTHEQLTSVHVSERLLFHPLSENGLVNEGELQAFFRQLIVARLNITSATLISDLVRLAGSEAKHRNLTIDQVKVLTTLDGADERMLKNVTALNRTLTNEQQEFLKALEGVDEDTAVSVSELITKMPVKQTERCITHIHMRKGGIVKGKAFKRVAAVSFPLYTELKKWSKEEEDKKAIKEEGHKPTKSAKGAGARSGRVVYDVEIRQKDREPLIQLLQYLFPRIDEPEAYNYGSNSSMAPNTDALMHTFMEMASHLNSIIALFSGVIDGIEKLEFDAEWVPAFENIDLMWPQVRDIPAQAVRDNSPPVTVAPPVVSNPVIQPAMAGAPMPQVVQPTVLPWQSHPAAPVQPVQGQGQWVNGQWVNGPAPAPYTAPVHNSNPAPSGGGSTFGSIMAANPALAGQQVNGQPNGYYHGQPQGQGGYQYPQQYQNQPGGYQYPQQGQPAATMPWHNASRNKY